MAQTVEHDLVELFARYSGVTVAEVEEATENHSIFGQVHWAQCEGSWEERARSFYGVADGYVFDLIHSNRSKTRLRQIYDSYDHMSWFERAGREVLEFGGGLGLACSIFRDLGRAVTYVDVDGPVSRFARWYFAETAQTDIEVLLTPSDHLVLPTDRRWDFVFSDSVIEHLADPVGTVDTLARAVRPGGLLYLIIDAHAVHDSLPMHREIHLADLLAGSETLASMEHVLHDGDGLNAFRQPAR